MDAQLKQSPISTLNPFNPELTADEKQKEQITGLGNGSEVPEWLQGTENPLITTKNEPIYSKPINKNSDFSETFFPGNSENKEKSLILATGEISGEQSLQNDPNVPKITRDADRKEAEALERYKNAHEVNSIV